MRGLFSFLLVIGLGALAQAQQAAPTAPDPRASEAKQHYENGMAHFNLEEWDAAIDEWKAGYRAKPVPQFLYNIAQAYRLSKHYDEALSFYQRYLRADPKAVNRVEVEGHITKLNAVLAQEKKLQTAPPTLPIAVKPKGAEGTAPMITSTEPSPAPQVAVVPSPQPTTTTTTTVVQKEPEKQSITKKKWFWPTIGAVIGVVVVAVVVGAAVGATSGDDTRVLPLARF